ncbi:retinal guanylyl cyclase 2-like [Saccostrea cucullata]|uniref:retinal guanylyl cyclase 2-like n=1 Tax=Saccostrea cuccullata TaxID=36930 RepID=UPI002ED12F21
MTSREIIQSEQFLMRDAIILAMNPGDAVSLMDIADKLGTVGHVYFLPARSPFFNTSIINEGVQNLGSHTYQSLFVLYPMFNSTVRPYNTTTHEPEKSDYVSKSLYDAASCIFQGMYNNYMNISVRNQRSVLDLVGTQFTNGNETFTYSATGERYFHFGLLDIEENLGRLTFSRVVYKQNRNGGWIQGIVSDIDWADDKAVQPDPCFMRHDCTPTDEINLGVAVAVPLTLLIIIGVGSFILIVLWKKRRKISMTKGPNKILLETEDLTYLHKKEAKSVKINSGPFLDKPDLVKTSEKSNRSLASLHEFSEFSEIAKYKGDVVFVKEIKVKGFEIKGKLLSYIRTLRDIRHENVNPLYGFLIDPLRPALVSEYCSRGSLWDVLKNENIKLDWDFKVSLLSDAVRGLRFIQNSTIRYHGNLKSRNCVIDSRWVLKLSDFGMPGFRECAKMTANYDVEQLLWTAPEHLRDPFPGMKGSEKGDIYSLSIITQEVILRQEPYAMLEYKTKELIQRLRNPPPLTRPKVSPQAAQPQYIMLMKQCWSENPDLRPSIEDIYQQYKSISGGKKTNIVDSMFRMLEKYSNDLEDIVKERTIQLEEEKKKTDLLLFRMLPPTVAEKLKLGRPIEAEEFAEVTIYFSDIVGFTTISARSTPMQVVDLLNDLYTMFDGTIDNYDVYKVETIGDAYMVVSGIPVPNGNRHAGEIGTMALDLLSQCGTFTIRHMPEVPLRLRIGLHSGTCVAGVVGLTMPRYCLFGDTVNTASRMESTGAAFRIHISQATKLVLDGLGGYIIEYRGEVELKGKGMAKTYWLIGKDGFIKPLPEPPPLNDGCNHGLDSILNPVASSTADLKESTASSESDGLKSISPSKVSHKERNSSATKEKSSKPKGPSHKGKPLNDNFSNINEVSHNKQEDHSDISHSLDNKPLGNSVNHSNSLSSFKKDNMHDHKKSSNYRMSKYSNAMADKINTEPSAVSTSELHMTVLSKHDDKVTKKLSPVAEV